MNRVPIKLPPGEEPVGWAWRFFSADELRCPCCGRLEAHPDFLDRLELLRRRHGRPLVVASAYRCPAHNRKVSSTGPAGPHTTGRAVDLAVRGGAAVLVLSYALNLGFTGIGVAQKGETRFLHLDDLRAPEHPRPAIWSY